MEPKIITASNQNEKFTPERCFVNENYSEKDISIARAKVKPGIKTIPHHLEGVQEIYLITQGMGRAYIESIEPKNVSTGDLVLIPAGKSQSIENIGVTDLVFYCICTPRFTQDCYVSEGE
jgi:mannose-6-phosphate isomerase-like protein (cupin superfamily)